MFLRVLTNIDIYLVNLEYICMLIIKIDKNINFLKHPHRSPAFGFRDQKRANNIIT